MGRGVREPSKALLGSLTWTPMSDDVAYCAQSLPPPTRTGHTRHTRHTYASLTHTSHTLHTHNCRWGGHHRARSGGPAGATHPRSRGSCTAAARAGSSRAAARARPGTTPDGLRMGRGVEAGSTGGCVCGLLGCWVVWWLGVHALHGLQCKERWRKAQRRRVLGVKGGLCRGFPMGRLAAKGVPVGGPTGRHGVWDGLMWRGQQGEVWGAGGRPSDGAQKHRDLCRFVRGTRPASFVAEDVARGCIVGPSHQIACALCTV